MKRQKKLSSQGTLQLNNQHALIKTGPGLNQGLLFSLLIIYLYARRFSSASFRGIKISVHWAFLFLLGRVLLDYARSGTNIQQLLWALLFVPAAFLCVTLIKANNIVLLPIGGIASIEKFPDNPRRELAISITGPLVNVAIALFL